VSSLVFLLWCDTLQAALNAIESKLEAILAKLTEGCAWRKAMQKKWEKLESGSLPAPRSSGTKSKSRAQEESTQDVPVTHKDNQKPTNPSREHGKQKGVPSSYSKPTSPFQDKDDEDEELGNETFPQKEGGLSPLDPVLPTDYEELSRKVQGIKLDPDCMWKKVNGFKGEYTKEVSALKKTFVCLEVCLKTLSVYEKLAQSGTASSIKDLIYDTRTSTLTAMYTILNHRKFLYSLSTTSEDVARIFNSVWGYGGELSRDEQEDLLFTSKMAREQCKSKFDSPRAQSNRERGRGERERRDFNKYRNLKCQDNQANGTDDK
jgi:hypothetical protein